MHRGGTLWGSRRGHIDRGVLGGRRLAWGVSGWGSIDGSLMHRGSNLLLRTRNERISIKNKHIY